MRLRTPGVQRRAAPGPRRLPVPSKGPSPGRAPEGHELVRAFVGGALRPDLAEANDGLLTEIVRRELDALVGIRATPVLVRVHRHPRAMPQYGIGHYSMVGFHLKNTLSEHGSVARGVCTSKGGKLAIALSTSAANSSSRTFRA